MDELISRAEVMKHMHFRINEEGKIEGFVRAADILSIPAVEVDLISRQDACEKTCEITRKSNATDTINRQAAINALDDDAELLRRVLDDTDIVGAERAKYEWGLCLIESYISDMNELPSAERKGKWMLGQTNGQGFIRCSHCGHIEFDCTPNFCPNCGADMRGVKDDS